MSTENELKGQQALPVRRGHALEWGMAASPQGPSVSLPFSPRHDTNEDAVYLLTTSKHLKLFVIKCRMSTQLEVIFLCATETQHPLVTVISMFLLQKDCNQFQD